MRKREIYVFKTILNMLNAYRSSKGPRKIILAKITVADIDVSPS